jgi:hypothetical protein
MADIEGGTPLSAKRRWPVVPVVTLLLGVLLGLLIPHPFGWRWSTPPLVASSGPVTPFVLGDWEYPKAKSHTKMEGGSSKITQTGDTRAVAIVPNLYAYSTSDALETVWGHYAKLSGIGDQEFKPGASSAKTDFTFSVSSGGGSGAMGGVLYYTGDPKRPSVRSATIVAQRPGYTVTVFITRSNDEDKTHISMVVEEKPAPPSS